VNTLVVNLYTAQYRLSSWEVSIVCNVQKLW